MPAPRARCFALALATLLGCGSARTSDSSSTNETTSSTTDSSSTGTDNTTSTETETEGDGVGFCQHQCMLDADCFIGGGDFGAQCIDNTCDLPDCPSDEFCVAQSSGWTSGIACTPGGGECEPTERICLEVLGEAHCVTQPTDSLPCEVLLFEVETVDIDGNPVVVCGKPNAICTDEGHCASPCSSDADCALLDPFPICNVDTGQCMCGSDADCQLIDSPNSVVCTPEGLCGCTEDQQCIDADRGDVCTPDGRCGCTSDMACANVNGPQDGGSYVCAEL